MKVYHKGPLAFLRDERGDVRGIWVEDLDFAQIDKPLKANLRMFLASLPGHAGDCPTAVTEDNVAEMYEAVASGRLHVQTQDPNKGGGYWLVVDDDSRIPAPTSSRPWWKFW
ncbi:MAG: hypothetical protein ACRESZ_19895 [Methylococcales bacterium]